MTMREADLESLKRIIRQRPSFHDRETEIARSFEPRESFLDPSLARKLASSGLTCYGIGRQVLEFIAHTVTPNSRTLETGAGCSTLVFAILSDKHTAITPSEREIQRIRAYAESNAICLKSVEFIAQPSERYLPLCDKTDLDLVLLDGKHAFPWPIVDWFYTADRLRKGGILLLDDAQLKPVAVLAEFLAVESAWELIQNFSGKTLAFRKIRDFVLDVAWHMQPWSKPCASDRWLQAVQGVWKRIRGIKGKARI
jgi:predicted O-methyltransferase YrrM